MNKEEMNKRIEAGDSLVDICLDKYREVQCKVINGEELDLYDVGANTCALCKVHNDMETIGIPCEKCPLQLAGHKCCGAEPDSAWSKLFDIVRNRLTTVTKEELLNAIDDMISNLKDARKYEVKEPEETAEEEYIRLQGECGLKVGDTVKVTRTAKDHEEGWANSWINEKMSIGDVGKITMIGCHADNEFSNDAVGIEINGDWQYPYFVLEKIEKTYHVGQHLLHSGGTEYLLARVESKTINLFSLSSGGKWSTPIIVSNDQEITEEEMKELADKLGQWKDFELIEE